MLVIVGSGHAGYTLAREYRRLNADGPVTLVTAESGESYYKPDLSKSAAKDPNSLVKASAASMADTLKLDLLTEQTVTGLDTVQKTLHLASGAALTYTQLVLATGARPLDLGFEVPRVNSLEDYRRFRHALSEGQAVTILGGGLIGCEFAHDLASHGYAVSVVELAERPLAALLSPELSHALQAALEALGVRWYLGHKAVAANGPSVTLDDGRTLDGAVLAAVGLRGNTELAQAAGLHTGVGVQVDALMRTSAAEVYALGDCVQWPDTGRLRPYILPIASAARNLAQTLNGQPTPTQLPAQPVAVKTPSLPLWVCPPAVLGTTWHSEGQGGDWVAKALDSDGRLRGFAVSGACVPQKNDLAKQVQV